LIAVDVVPERRALAAKLGATETINSASENPTEKIFQFTQGRGADLAFEAVGVTATVDLALRCLRKGGAATLVGNVAPKIQFPLHLPRAQLVKRLGCLIQWKDRIYHRLQFSRCSKFERRLHVRAISPVASHQPMLFHEKRPQVKRHFPASRRAASHDGPTPRK